MSNARLTLTESVEKVYEAKTWLVNLLELYDHTDDYLQDLSHNILPALTPTDHPKRVNIHCNILELQTTLQTPNKDNEIQLVNNLVEKLDTKNNADQKLIVLLDCYSGFNDLQINLQKMKSPSSFSTLFKGMVTVILDRITKNVDIVNKMEKFNSQDLLKYFNDKKISDKEALAKQKKRKDIKITHEEKNTFIETQNIQLPLTREIVRVETEVEQQQKDKEKESQYKQRENELTAISKKTNYRLSSTSLLRQKQYAENVQTYKNACDDYLMNLQNQLEASITQYKKSKDYKMPAITRLTAMSPPKKVTAEITQQYFKKNDTHSSLMSLTFPNSQKDMIDLFIKNSGNEKLHQSWEIYKLIQNGRNLLDSKRPESKTYENNKKNIEEFKQHLAENKKMLNSQLQDPAYITFLKVLGVIAATILGFGVGGYYAYRGFFGKQADARAFKSVVDKTEPRMGG